MIKEKKLISDIADYKLRELTNKKKRKGKITRLRLDNEYVCINDIILLQTNIPSSIFKIDESTSLHSIYRTMAGKDYKKCVLITELNDWALLYNEGNRIATFNANYLKYFENPLKLEYYAIDYKSAVMVKDEFHNKAFIMPIKYLT